MPLLYLQVEEARSRLVAAGDYTTETLPSNEALELVLESIEIKVEGWLGYSLPAQDYEEILKVSEVGTALMKQYPVIAVYDVDRVRDFHVEVDPEVKRVDMRSVWRQGATLHVGSFYDPDTPIRVRYRAGLDPLPRDIKPTFFQMLRVVLQKSGTTGDLSFLDEPTRDTNSLSLPGGMSKGWQIGKANAGIDGLGETELDRILKSLSKYRRRFTL